MEIENVKTRIYKADKSEADGEYMVIREHMLALNINGILAFRIVCTRSGLKELVLGRLYTEGFISGLSDIESIDFFQDEKECWVVIPKVDMKAYEGYELTCCAGNSQFVEGCRYNIKRTEYVSFDPDDVFAMAEAFSKETHFHGKSSGTHSCFAGKMGEVLACYEDIGRHNALDKVIGHCILNGIDLNDVMVFTSGRVPVDMVKKVIGAGIPVLISKAVPTVESIELAKDYKLRLICRAWPDQFEVF